MNTLLNATAPVQPGQQLPAFILPNVRGQTVDLSSFRQWRNVIALFLGSIPGAEIQQLLRTLAQNHSAFGDENTIVLTVLAGSFTEAAILQGRLALPFTLLVDAECQVHQRLGLIRNQSALPLVYILDRAGVVVTTYPSVESATLPTADELLAWVRYIELRCPE